MLRKLADFWDGCCDEAGKFGRLRAQVADAANVISWSLHGIAADVRALREAVLQREAAAARLTETCFTCPFCGRSVSAVTPSAVVRHEWRSGNIQHIAPFVVTTSHSVPIACCPSLVRSAQGLTP